MGSGVSVEDKIQFVAPEATLAVDGREHPHDTDINRVVAPNESVLRSRQGHGVLAQHGQELP